MAHDTGQVALIATTELSLARLRDVLVDRITNQDHGSEYHQSGYVYRRQFFAKQSNREISESVMSMLERVQVCRVFDFPGIAEAVTEFGAKLEIEHANAQSEIIVKKCESGRHIVDSEDDAECESSPETDGEKHVERDATSGQANMIVIDNMANVVGSMLAKSQVQGHAILTTFMRSLHHLTKQRHICTLIANGAVGLRQKGTQYQANASEHISIFSSTTGRPALGKHFTYFIDTSIYLSMLPRSKKDADIAYGDVRETRRFDEVRVIEVLKDRYGNREGRWTPFNILAGTELQSVRLCE